MTDKHHGLIRPWIETDLPLDEDAVIEIVEGLLASPPDDTTT